MSTMIIDWKTTPMQFWQNQLNFAVWCSTSGCGVTYDDHIMASDVFMKSLYRCNTPNRLQQDLVKYFFWFSEVVFRKNSSKWGLLIDGDFG